MQDKEKTYNLTDNDVKLLVNEAKTGWEKNEREKIQRQVESEIRERFLKEAKASGHLPAFAAQEENEEGKRYQGNGYDMTKSRDRALQTMRLIRATALVMRQNRGGQATREQVANVINEWNKSNPTKSDEVLKNFLSKGTAPLTIGLNTQSLEQGGLLIGEGDYLAMLDLLTEESVFSQLPGIDTLRTDKGVVHVPKQISQATAQWIGEGSKIPLTKYEYGTDMYTLKKLGTQMLMSNEIYRRSDISLDSKIQQELGRAISEKVDSTFLRAKGGVYSPKGLRYLTKPSNVIGASSGTLNAALVKKDLTRMVQLLRYHKVRMNNAVWILTPRTFYFLQLLETPNGAPVFPSLQNGENPSLMNHRVFVTQEIPDNLGTDGEVPDNPGPSDTATEIYFGIPSNLIKMTGLNMEFEMSGNVLVSTGEGTTVNCWEQDMTAIKVVHETELALLRPESWAIMNGVKWYN